MVRGFRRLGFVEGGLVFGHFEGRLGEVVGWSDI